MKGMKVAAVANLQSMTMLRPPAPWLLPVPQLRDHHAVTRHDVREFGTGLQTEVAGYLVLGHKSHIISGDVAHNTAPWARGGCHVTVEHTDGVNEAALRSLVVDQGWHIVIHCYEDARLFRHSWYGSWGVRVVRPDGGEERTLVLHRAPDQERRFNTVVPLFTLVEKYDILVVQIPIRAGGRGVNVPAPPQWGRRT